VYNIKLDIGNVVVDGTLDDSPLAERIVKLLPFEAMGETWGREVYFPVALRAENANPVIETKVGDIAYWPDGPDLCLFFGTTPKSTGEAPVSASPVTVIGTFQCRPEDFDRFERRRHGIKVRVQLQQ
jgi:uncharacterized protein